MTNTIPTVFGLSKTYGVSMRPLIWGGKHAVASVSLDGEPSIGDLLIFRHTYPDGKAATLVHRLVGIHRDGDDCIYIMRGDNSIGSENVRKPDILGRVTEIHLLTGYRPWYIIPYKKITVKDPLYLIYSRLWRKTWPLRRPLFLLRARIHHLLNPNL